MFLLSNWWKPKSSILMILNHRNRKSFQFCLRTKRYIGNLLPWMFRTLLLGQSATIAANNFCLKTSSSKENYVKYVAYPSAMRNTRLVLTIRSLCAESIIGYRVFHPKICFLSSTRRRRCFFTNFLLKTLMLRSIHIFWCTCFVSRREATSTGVRQV